MSFDEDLFQPHVSNRAEYYRLKDSIICEGFLVASPAYGSWTANELDRLLNIAVESSIDFRYLILNTWFDAQFFFKTEADQSFFLIKFSEELAKRDNIGYVK